MKVRRSLWTSTKAHQSTLNIITPPPWKFHWVPMKLKFKENPMKAPRNPYECAMKMWSRPWKIMKAHEITTKAQESSWKSTKAPWKYHENLVKSPIKAKWTHHENNHEITMEAPWKIHVNTIKGLQRSLKHHESDMKVIGDHKQPTKSSLKRHQRTINAKSKQPRNTLKASENMIIVKGKPM